MTSEVITPSSVIPFANPVLSLSRFEGNFFPMLTRNFPKEF